MEKVKVCLELLLWELVYQPFFEVLRFGKKAFTNRCKSFIFLYCYEDNWLDVKNDLLKYYLIKYLVLVLKSFVVNIARFNTGGEVWIGFWLFIKCNISAFYMVVCLAHAYIKPKELKVLMNKINALITFDMFFVYVVLKYALVILENLPSCELCLKKSYLKLHC